ncbi:MAG: methyltransferase domain-containing protein [Chlamydiae bacterium]|nr:methyltransferase domain-containing protein [Chlamydiota bacterium]
MNKTAISANFNSAASTYDNYALVQKKAARILVDSIDEILPKTALDVGAGTGFVTEILIKKFPDAIYTLNDIANEMLNQARRKFFDRSNITYNVADAENAIFPKHPYDLVVSNLTFQWFENIKLGIKNLWDQSQSLFFSTLVKGSFLEWSNVHKKLDIPCRMDTYNEIYELKKICLDLNPRQFFFKVENESFFFEDPLEFIRCLKRTGANTPLQKNQVFSLNKILKQFPYGMPVNYKIFYGAMIR